MPSQNDPPDPLAEFYDHNRAIRRILAELKSLGVLASLSTKQQVKLANHVLMVTLHHKLWVHDSKPHDKWINVWFARSPAQLRKLRAKIAKLKALFDDLTHYVGSIGTTGPEQTGNFYLRTVLDAEFGLTRSLDEASAVLERLRIPAEALVEHAPWLRRGAENPEREATSTLVGFFADDCGTSHAEARVRTGKIGNAFWGWNLTVREDYRDGNAKGSDAIRKRLTRTLRSSASRDIAKKTRR